MGCPFFPCLLMMFLMTLKMPKNIIISDTSCLIVLSRIQQLELLKKMYETIIISKEVAEEFGEDLPPWVIVKEVSNKSFLRVLVGIVDLGEASAIALALEHEDALLIVDDLKGRKEARRLGLRITGLLGVLLKCKQKGIISEIKPLLEAMKNASFRISKEIELFVLEKAGE